METEGTINILLHELAWLESVINQVIRSYLLQEGHEKHWTEIPLPETANSNSPYATKVKEWNLDLFGRLALSLGLATYLRPEILDIFFGKNQLYDRTFTEFGGTTDKNHSGFLPTAQTFIFLATATNPEWKNKAFDLLKRDYVLLKEEVLTIGSTESYLPIHNGTLTLNPDWFNYFITGEHLPIEHGNVFPAQKITTPLEWADIVLDDHVAEQITEIQAWLEHGNKLMTEWNLAKKIKPGYRCLFHGPPGTGKTLTATLLGKTTGKDVYKIDLSMVVSKYIGETEKNLARVFDIAQHKNWILFFDEADSLFGKRTETNSSNDRYANQQTAYLLQRIEDYPGVAILATNLNSNMDEAFTRRFQSIIQFKMPGPEERLQLWKNAFSDICTLHTEIDMEQISEEHELAGGAIINVLRTCALSAIRRNDSVVSKSELQAAIRKELRKENKTLFV
jgi:AAA+ superfamily predicted ATPase